MNFSEIKQRIFDKIFIRDRLTGAYTYKHFMEMLEKEIKRSSRYQSTFSLILFSFDEFEKFKKTHGDSSGDKFLKEMVGLMRRKIRDVDYFSRYVNDNFIITLPNTNLDGARIVGDRMNNLVSNEKISETAQPAVKITASFGIVSCALEGEDVNSLLKKAESALQTARSQEGDRIYLCRDQK